MEFFERLLIQHLLIVVNVLEAEHLRERLQKKVFEKVVENQQVWLHVFACFFRRVLRVNCLNLVMYVFELAPVHYFEIKLLRESELDQVWIARRYRVLLWVLMDLQQLLISVLYGLQHRRISIKGDASATNMQNAFLTTAKRNKVE